MTNFYLDKIAIDISKSADSDAIMSDEDLPLYRIYAVLLLAKGQDVTAEDVHNAWAAWACVYEPDSQNIIPFKELSHRVQQKDKLYVDTIHKVSKRMHIDR